MTPSDQAFPLIRESYKLINLGVLCSYMGLSKKKWKGLSGGLYSLLNKIYLPIVYGKIELHVVNIKRSGDPQ